MSVDYDYEDSPRTIAGPFAALSCIFKDQLPGSLLDVDCGIGTWIHAAEKLGVQVVWGIDGQAKASDRLLFSKSQFSCHNLRQPFDLGRKFDLEVAEHLPREAAEPLVRSLVAHSDSIYFSAALQTLALSQGSRPSFIQRCYRTWKSPAACCRQNTFARFAQSFIAAWAHKRN